MRQHFLLGLLNRTESTNKTDWKLAHTYKKNSNQRRRVEILRYADGRYFKWKFIVDFA